MTNEKDVAKRYKQKQIETATPLQILLFLYNAAFDHMRVAEQAFHEKKPDWIEVYHKSLVMCQTIITELTVALDMEKGGDLAQKLFQLYDYMNYRLVSANVNKNIEELREVRGLLETLKKAWDHLAEKEVKERGGATAEGPSSSKLATPSAPASKLNVKG